MRAGSRAWSRVLVLGLLALSCRKPATTETTASPQPLAADTPAKAVRRPASRGPTSTAIARAPVELLPEGTDIAVTIASPQRLFHVFDVPALVSKYRAQYDQAAAGVEQLTGYNLLDPGKWAQIGVDADGPVGGALLHADSETWCLYFSLTDPPRFRDFLDRMQTKIGGRLDTVYEDRGMVLAHEPGARYSLVLRDNFAFYVNVGNANRVPYDFARELASIDPSRGLSASAQWKQAFGPTTPRDFVGFFDMGGMIRNELAAQRPDELSPSWAEQEMERLREQGAPAEEVARWQKIADEQRVAEVQARERRRRERELWASVFSPMGPLVVELSLTQQAISGSMRMQAPESALVRRVLRARGGEALALTAAGERVVFGTGISVDVAESVAALEMVMRADGKDPALLWAEAERELGINPKTAVGALDGSMSFALTIKDPALLATSRGKEALGFTFALGLKDVASAQSLLGAIGNKLPPFLKVRKAGRGYAVAVEGWREVHVGVVGSNFAASTDPEFLRRVERGARGPIDRTLPAAVVPVVSEREAASVWMMDYLFPLGTYMSRSGHYEDTYAFGANQPYWRFPGVDHAKIDAVPQSPAFKAKMKDWNRLTAKIRRMEEGAERKRTELLMAAMAGLGSVALNLRETADGLATSGGQYFGPGGLARALEASIEALSTAGTTDYTLHGERGQLENEMQELRTRDIERALGVTRGQ